MDKNLLEKLVNITKAKKELEDQEKEIKSQLETTLTEEGYKDEFITISYSKPSETTSIDLKKLEEQEPDLFNELLADYPKVTSRKASYKYIVK